MPQLAAALRKAGYGTTAERLRDIGVEVLAVHSANNTAAREALHARVVNHADLLGALFAPFREQALKRYLDILTDKLAEEARLLEPRRPKVPRDTSASKPTQSFGQLLDEHRPTLAGSMLAREEARREAKRAAQSVVGEVLRRSRLEMFRIDNRPLAELSVGAARGWALGRGREARWILLMTANMPHDFIVGQSVTADEAEMYWHRARDDADE